MSKTKKNLGRLGAILLALIMCLAMLPTVAFAEGKTTLTSDGGELASGNYILEDDITLSADITIPEGAEVTLDLNGYTLTGTGENSVILMYGSLTLEDSSGDNSGVITGGVGTTISGGVLGGGILVYGGTLTMNGGTISGNKATKTSSTWGAGVAVIYQGKFTMNGGVITDNLANNYGRGGGVCIGTQTGITGGTFIMNGGTISENNANWGGGVAMSVGSADCISIFIMNGGSIQDNICTNYGAGVWMISENSEGTCSFEMNGGTISGNASGQYGGGVRVAAGCDFTMNAGTISGNTAGTVEDASAGGVYVAGTFTMNGGTIANNTATIYGGGVDVISSGTFTLVDGTISGNTAVAGGGIFCNGSLVIEGGNISNNTSSERGGGIYFYPTGSDLTFTMTDGSILGNTSGTVGGGVYAGTGSIFNLSGGVISNNTSGTFGGGVYVRSTFNMTGGSITGNTAGTYSGGIHIASSGVVNMSGGSITNNSCASEYDGGGVYQNGSFNVSGTPVISGNTDGDGNTNNVYLPTGKCISLLDGLDGGAEIGVITETAPTEEADVQITTSETEDGTTYYVSALQYFSSDEGYYKKSDTALDADVLTVIETVEKVSYPGLTKTIVTADGEVKQDDVAAGDTVDYKLTSTFPSILTNYIDYTYDEESSTAVGTVKTYVVTDEDGNPTYDDEGNVVTATYTYTLTFHDVMDSTLSLNDDLKVSIGETLLENTEDVTYYTVTTSTTDGCTFEISMDLLALYSAGIITEDDFGTTEIVVTYSAKLSSAATAGAYYNTAWVVYPNGESEKDKVEVDTYKLSVFKYDQADGTGLEGAVFTLTYPDGTTKTLTSDENGYITVDGLDAGTYTLVETTAPSGYVKADTVLTVIIPTDVTNYVASVSFANAAIPSIGGAGTTMYTIAGVCILLAAGAIFMISRKERNAE